MSIGSRASVLGVTIALGLGCAHAAPRAPVRVADGRPAMGTVLEIRLDAPDAAAGRALLDRLFGEVAAIEAELSTWEPASAASRLNDAAGSGPVSVPPRLHAILDLSLRAARETDGVFDVTVGPLIGLWRRAATRGALPEPEAIATARDRVGAGAVALTPGQASLPAGAVVSFDGVVKGWALDRLGELLEDAAVTNALLDFGGSSWLARGAPEGREGWRVLVAGRAGRRLLTELRDESLSVSESLGQETQIGERRFGHVIDPRSGWPVEVRRLAAVRAEGGAEAEVWSTALLVLGREEGRAKIEARPELDALWLEADGRAHHTAGFPVERVVGLHDGAAP